MITMSSGGNILDRCPDLLRKGKGRGKRPSKLKKVIILCFAISCH